MTDTVAAVRVPSAHWDMDARSRVRCIDHRLRMHFSLELWRSQSKALLMIVDAPWYVPNTVIRRNLETPTVKEEIRSAQRTRKRSNSEPHGATRQQAIAKTPAKWSAYQIPSVIVVFVILVFSGLIAKSHKRSSTN
jgi:hypothetical protein